jgi:hypothetical protein
MSLKTISGSFVPHDAQEQIASDLDTVVKACGDVIEAVRAILTHQASLVSKQGILPGSLGTKSTSSEATSLVESTVAAEQLLEQQAEKAVDAMLQEEEELFEQHPEIQFRRSEQEHAEKMLVRGGSLMMLVNKLTYHKLPAADFTSAFLLTYRSFTTASELLDLLIKRYAIETPPNLHDMKQKYYQQKKVIPVRLRVFNVLKMWVKNNYCDFENDETLLNRLCDFVPTMKSDFHRGTIEFQALLDRRARGEFAFNKPQSFGRPPPSILPKTIAMGLSVFDFDPLELARQLTLIQWEVFVAIQPSECLNQSWNKKELHHRSPHIREMIKFANFVSLY